MQLDISIEAKRFNEHLNIENNDRIIFSGIFGIGKTYFLKEFFKARDEYEVFNISPVNYSISSNDDVINYIKYDLAFQLLGKNVVFEKLDISKIVATEYYIKNNALETISTLAKGLGKIGKSIIEVVEPVKTFKDKVEAYQEEHSTNEKKDIVTFLEQIRDQNGSIYEEDMITQLVGQLINSSKKFDDSGKITKQTILVIDDLDRLDPDHIFRILNIFACHFDLDTSDENKFNLDKIILVCDMDNIRKIFHHRYGVGVDFNGYLDKFYSHEIFYYDNKVIIKKNIENILASITLMKNMDRYLNFKNPGLVSVRLLTGIIEGMIHLNLLNLRSFIKFNNKELSITPYSFIKNEYNAQDSNFNYNLILIFDLLCKILGSPENLKIILDKLLSHPSLKIPVELSGDLLTLINLRKHNNISSTYEYINKDEDIIINYTIQNYGHTRSQETARIDKIFYYTSKKPRVGFPFNKLLKEAFDEYLNLEIVS